MKTRPSESLGEFILRIRTEKNLSLMDVSKRSGRGRDKIAASYINRLEVIPTRKPTANKLRALARGLDVPAEELLMRA